MMRLPDPNPQLIQDLLEGEKVYPIYDVMIKWPMDISYDVSEFGPPWFEGLPRGQMWDSRNWNEMPKQARPLHEITDEVKTVWWPKMEKKGVDPGEPTINVKFVRWETWCQGWFSHWAHDVGLDDSKVLQSFYRFVCRMEDFNQRERKRVKGHWQEPYCLMGAEERGRWYGRTTGHQDDEQVDPPCRCPSCKDRGVVTIGH